MTKEKLREDGNALVDGEGGVRPSVKALLFMRGCVSVERGLEEGIKFKEEVKNKK